MVRKGSAEHLRMKAAILKSNHCSKSMIPYHHYQIQRTHDRIDYCIYLWENRMKIFRGVKVFNRHVKKFGTNRI